MAIRELNRPRTTAASAIKLLTHFSPQCVLVVFRRVGVFFVFKPEAKPIHITLLRCRPLQGFLQEMISEREID